MFETVLSVKYVSEKNCFVYLSPKHKNVNTGMCMKMTNDSTEAFFSAKVISNIVEFDSIAINSTYAKLLGFQENELVNVSNVSQSPVVTCVIIKPLTQPDYEVLEMFSQNVQSNLLDQVRVIHSGQKLVIWIGNSLTVSVMVENVQPVSPGALDFLTEVVIEPPHNSSHGRPGTGKSSVMENISRTLNSYPYFIKTEIVYCKNIKGKTLESLHKFFTDLLSNLILSQPALLILDDLQVLCEVWEGEETPNTIFSNRVSEMLHTLFIDTQKVHAVGILASTDLVSKLNKHIYRSRGNHLYKNVFTMEDLNKADRILLLKHFLGKHLVDTSLDYEELALKTDGFVVQDIEDFYTKALFEAYKDRQEDRQTPMITQEHCLVALKKTCALSLQSITFHNGNRKSFEDIGGLHDVKNVLIESLMWPAKYPNIFSHAPLRLQSGILLYGPPGTGKTLIAGAAAKQCGLRLISIKGPELLSKYIGASEQGVRDVFVKAQLAKPCILFFDEFDSLAPRRGHDNTGVTDRVVNQLLTQLDGVEALTGVCVLAATSRPDLLDPALLRPGRLDKQLICSMPNYDDRLEILNILSSKLDLAEDVKMEEIAQKTEGYSGADLQSVLFTAQISTMKDCVSTDSIEAQPLKTSHEVILQSLSQTKPSLPKSERAKYERIYKKFSGRSVETFNTGSRVTLA
ncbi:peroxisome biogenesis factor 1-like isoform X4 [Dendroctonus ponderosae]|uniref:peroxisome biogenesis factor 1 isoform X4 n=1 Tax=Dendroctonus ponderosae TaxID=77166 RepID=UPI0020360BD1|nr:peroxisome biogenesis factor 1 isoform X4 [Dendroctonus ponderosae]XP_048525523.1 peroxisome biogenesis factor 1-like isoform X4 [Dendroctonus ponderosae]